MHVVVGLAGHPLDASLEGYDASKVFNKTFDAVAFHPRPKKKGGLNLLGGSTTGEEVETEGGGEGKLDSEPKKKGKEEDAAAASEKEEQTEERAPPLGGGWGGSGGAKGGDGEKKEASSSSSSDKAPREIISFLKPNLTVAMIDDFQAYARGKIPEQVRAVGRKKEREKRERHSSAPPPQTFYVLHSWPFSPLFLFFSLSNKIKTKRNEKKKQMVKILDLDHETHTYNPSLWLNDFWLMRSHLLQMNETVTAPVQLHLSLYSLPSWKLLLFTSMEHSFQVQQSWGAMNDGEPDELKRVLTEGNPYFLALTMCVSMLHSVFDALAFKNDIGFWKGKQDVAGLSVRTIGFNAICQVRQFFFFLKFFWVVRSATRSKKRNLKKLTFVFLTFSLPLSLPFFFSTLAFSFFRNTHTQKKNNDKNRRSSSSTSSTTTPRSSSSPRPPSASRSSSGS